MKFHQFQLELFLLLPVQLPVSIPPEGIFRSINFFCSFPWFALEMSLEGIVSLANYFDIKFYHL